MADDDDSSKTEEPTPERERKAREEGQFPRARELGAIAATLAILLYIAALGPGLARTLTEYTRQCLSSPHGLLGNEVAVVGADLSRVLALTFLPPALIAAVVSGAMGFLQAGFQPRLELAAPKAKRLDPIGHLKHLLDPKETGMNIALSLGKVAVVAAVTYWVVSARLPHLMALARTPLDAGVAELFDILMRVALWSTLALAVLAGLEFLKSYVKHRQDLMMSRKELKDEIQQQEGDARVKARQRARAREIAKRGIAKEVKTADVVVANPEHVAVALRYRPEQGAPVVVAKGYDDIAQYIKKLARESGVPVLERRELARALAAEVRVGRVIPVEYYAAVAEILALVYRLRSRGMTA